MKIIYTQLLQYLSIFKPNIISPPTSKQIIKITKDVSMLLLLSVSSIGIVYSTLFYPIYRYNDYTYTTHKKHIKTEQLQ